MRYVDTSIENIPVAQICISYYSTPNFRLYFITCKIVMLIKNFMNILKLLTLIKISKLFFNSNSDC